MKLNNLNRRIVALGALAAAIILTLPAVASAQRGAGARGGGMFNSPAIRMWTLVDEDLEDFKKQLTLNETQTEGLTALLEDFQEKNKQGLDEYAEMRQSMPTRGAGGGGRGAGGGAGGGGGNREAMQAAFQRMQVVLEKLGPVFEELHTAVGELLDEDQTKKLAELLQPPRRPGG